VLCFVRRCQQPAGPDNSGTQSLAGIRDRPERVAAEASSTMHHDNPGHVEATMRSTSAAASRPERRTQHGRDAEANPLAPDPRGQPESKDDGSVPDKQINRWEGEGGSSQPS
jgi:hypothetical protein